MAHRLRLVALGPLASAPGLLEWLAPELERRLALSIEPQEPLPLRPEWREPQRDQFSSNAIVDALIERGADDPSAGDAWVLALTEADLFAPGREFVFGEAALGGRWAVVSLARLRSVEPERLRQRVLKECLHELGHLSGLPHCDRPECVMFPSLGLAETDFKQPALCPVCHARRSRPGLDRASHAR